MIISVTADEVPTMFSHLIKNLEKHDSVPVPESLVITPEKNPVKEIIRTPTETQRRYLLFLFIKRQRSLYGHYVRATDSLKTSLLAALRQQNRSNLCVTRVSVPTSMRFVTSRQKTINGFEKKCFIQPRRNSFPSVSF